MFKMIVVDLDGTLLNQKGFVSKETEKYLIHLKKKGYSIAIATGRIYPSILKVTRGATFANFLISDTGACIYKETNPTPIFQNYIPKETVLKFFDYYNEDVINMEVCNHNTFYSYDKVHDNSDFIFQNGSEVTHAAIVMTENQKVEEMAIQLQADFKEVETIIMQDSFGEKKWIEILPKNCSKENAIKVLIDWIGIRKEEVIAFGDGLNDTGMLSFCGRGIAMQNALKSVKEVADDSTEKDHNHDGVIAYLKKIGID